MGGGGEGRGGVRTHVNSKGNPRIKNYSLCMCRRRKTPSQITTAISGQIATHPPRARKRGDPSPVFPVESL